MTSPSYIEAVEKSIDEKSDRIEQLERERDEALAAQSYTYIGKNMKPILARDLEDAKDAAEAKLAKAVEERREALDNLPICSCNYDNQTMADRIEELEREMQTLTTAGIIEVAVRNPSVADYVQHWEGRAEAAEAKLAEAGIIALETILSERGLVFDAMVEAAEDAAGKDVSFNVVVGRAIRAALAVLAELEGKDE
jgi:ATP-dependent Clp protease ATP-binding subunit ClpA